MRLFIAVNFSEEIKRRIKTVQEQIRKETEGGKFSLPENLHLTLVFLGETPEERLTAVKDAMIEALSIDGKPVPSFEIAFSNADFFKRGGKELWWLGPETKENNDSLTSLKELQNHLVVELQKRNFIIDSKPFTAHITLGREIRGSLWPFKTETIIIPVTRLSLMLSRHMPTSGKRNTLVYTELAGFDFFN